MESVSILIELLLLFKRALVLSQVVNDAALAWTPGAAQPGMAVAAGQPPPPAGNPLPSRSTAVGQGSLIPLQADTLFFPPNPPLKTQPF